MINKKQTLMKRRRNAIIVAAVVVAVLAISLVFIMDFARTLEIFDPLDSSTSYFIRYKGGEYKLFAEDKRTPVPMTDTKEYYEMNSGTLVELDAKTGAYEVIIVDYPTEGNEELVYFSRYLMFPHIERSDIRKIAVYNAGGSYTFCRIDENDDTSAFIIDGAPRIQYDGQKFSSLVVNAGYAITNNKIVDPIKDAEGKFTEYGLVPAVRPLFDEETGEPVMMYDEQGEPVLDEQGEHKQQTYEYSPAYYILTDTSGRKYKVIIGDMLPDGSGYYAQYVDMSGESESAREAVYVLNSSYGDTVLADIESYATPMLTQPMSLNNYFDVRDFFIFAEDGSGEFDVTVGFSYVDMADREGTLREREPFIFMDRKLSGYKINTDNAYICLEDLYEPAFAGVKKVAPTWEELVEYGLAYQDGTNDKGEPLYSFDGEYAISFKFDHAEDGATEQKLIYYVIYFSDYNENGNRYAITELHEVSEDGGIGELMYTFDMVVEVEDHSVGFLEWSSDDWIYNNYFQLDIAFCDKISVSSGDYWAEFDLDNSKSDMSDEINSSYLSIAAKDSAGNDRVTFSGLEVVDNNGNIWTITSKNVECHTPEGEGLRLKIADYAENAIGKNVKVLTTYIKAADGSKVYVTADEVRVEALSPEKSVTYNRYDTDLFREFYKTLLGSRIANTYELSEEDEKALLQDESKLLLTLTVLDVEGEETVYRFYKLTSRKAYITVNGSGGFYVQSDRTEKIVSDIQKFFANMPI